MGDHHERTGRIEALRGLTERLSAPDLTLAEAKVLRERLADLLERADRPGARDFEVPTFLPCRDWCGGPRHEPWSPEATMRSAG